MEADWDDRPRRDNRWVTALVCPVLVGLNVGDTDMFWSVATEAHETGRDISADPDGLDASTPRAAFRSAFKSFSNALIVFVMVGALGLIALGLIALKLPGAPSAPIQVTFATGLFFATSLVGWEIGEIFTGKAFSKAYGEPTATVCRLLIPHAVIGWIVFAAAMFGIYTS